MPRVKKELTREEQELFSELKKLSKRANQRIVRLEREFGKDTWATKYLKEKLATEPLQAWSISGRVKANKSMTVTQMKATIKATKEFLNSSISTKRGVKKAKQKAIKTLKKRFSTDVSDISYEEAEALTNFFEDKDVNKSTNFIPGSNILGIIESYREMTKPTFPDFVNSMKAMQQYNKGKEIKQLRNIYIKYIAGKKKGDTKVLFSYLEDNIAEAESVEELYNIEDELNNLLKEKIMKEKEYNYFINLLESRKNEIF